MKRLVPAACGVLALAVVGCGKSEVGVGQWLRVGECEVQVESVQFGKVKGKGMFGPAESREEVLSVRTLFRNADSSREVKHSPWQSDSTMLVSGITLTDERGNKYKTIHFGMFGQIEGRQQKDAELKASDPPASDVLTFEGGAGKAEVLILELAPQWFIKNSDGSWSFNSLKDKKFRFRIPRSAWEK
jgi:hypothetical protein